MAVFFQVRLHASRRRLSSLSYLFLLVYQISYLLLTLERPLESSTNISAIHKSTDLSPHSFLEQADSNERNIPPLTLYREPPWPLFSLLLNSPAR